MLPGIFSGVVATVFHIHIYGREAGQGKGVQSGGGYKARKGKARENETKEGPRTGVRTSGKTNDAPGCPIYIGQAQGERNI